MAHSIQITIYSTHLSPYSIRCLFLLGDGAGEATASARATLKASASSPFGGFGAGESVGVLGFDAACRTRFSNSEPPIVVGEGEGEGEGGQS